ncbi:MAG: SDR family NAD(P)-dependent oxidoreductase [Sphingomonadales bacterium]|nr:SDR family NAD(P)-dependent oxidoreductase [Sphingomonadales bacterium]
MKNPKNIIITGASSGIGETLALSYAAEGVALGITGRNAERLEQVATALREKGAHVDAQILDVADKKAMSDWIADFHKSHPIDLVVANAGVGIGTGGKMSLAEATEKTFDVNVYGVFHTVHPALDIMRKRKHGQIAIVASIAGLLGLPSSAPYSASKNAVRAYGEALRGAYAKDGVEVNVICPGYVESRMTAQNKFKMPFLMTSEKAIGIIRRGLEKNKARIAFPFPTYGMMRLMQILPVWLSDKLLRKLPKK